MIQKWKQELDVDERSREVREKGVEPFDFTAYATDSMRELIGNVPAHWHQQWEVLLLLSGEIRGSAGDRVFHLRPGEGCFINTEVLHSFYSDSPFQYRSFVFSPAIVGGMPGSVFDNAYVRPLLEAGPPYLKFSGAGEDAVLVREFERAFEASAGEAPGYELEIRASLSRMVLRLRDKSRVLPAPRVTGAQEERVKEMLRFIDGHLADEVTVGDVAATANICVRECQRLFKRYLHCGPIEYLRRRRVFSAAEKLAFSDEPVTDVALSCGFSSPSYFSKQFKDLTGSTPSEYREAVQKSGLPEN